MDPHYQQQALINEVLYLHSLHHHGPQSIATSSPSPPPNHLHLSNLPSFKKPKKNKKQKKPKKIAKVSGKEWPVTPFSGDSPATTSGWPELKLKPKIRIPTKQELDIKIWNETQLKGVKRVTEYYKKNKIFENVDDDVSSDDLMDDDDDDVNSDDGGEFFWKLFEEGEGELKAKYVEYCCGGVNGCEFVCLVCSGVNENVGKRFKDCVGLVQHAVSIGKTKKRRDHRVFGKVVCKVLGWDIDRLPSSTVAGNKDGEVKANDVNANVDVCSSGLSKVVDNGISNWNANDDIEPVDFESMVCEGSDVNADQDVHIDVCNAGSNKITDTGSSNGKAHDVSETVGESMVCEDFAVVANAEGENRINEVLNDEHTKSCQQSLQELVINDSAGNSTSKKVDDNE